MSTLAQQTAWAAGLRVGRRIYRTFSEDRAAERDQQLMETWIAMIRELLDTLPPDERLTSAEWDAMLPEAKVAACDDLWFDFERFTFAAQRAEIADALETTRRN